MSDSFDPATDLDDEAGQPVAESAGRPSTGHARIDEALTRLDGLAGLQITQHPDEFDAIHRVLRESLASAGRDEDAPETP